MAQANKKRTRIVPIVLGFDHFGAGRGDKLAQVEFQSLGCGRLAADVRLLHVFQLVRRIDEPVGAPVKEVEMGSERRRIVIQRQFGRAQSRLVGVIVEVIKVVGFSVRPFGRIVGIVGVVAVDKSAHGQRADRPGLWVRWSSRGWRGRSGRRVGAVGVCVCAAANIPVIATPRARALRTLAKKSIQVHFLHASLVG